jgi:hypothetical protein
MGAGAAMGAFAVEDALCAESVAQGKKIANDKASRQCFMNQPPGPELINFYK